MPALQKFCIFHEMIYGITIKGKKGIDNVRYRIFLGNAAIQDIKAASIVGAVQQVICRYAEVISQFIQCKQIGKMNAVFVVGDGADGYI